MKRSAEDDWLQASAKRILTESSQEDDAAAAETASLFSADSFSASTAQPAHTAAATSITATTAASRKFPSDLKTIQCTFPGCSKTFNRPARLTAHLRSHTGDRAFKCPYEGCDKDYLEDKHLQSHIKGCHTHEKPYICLEPRCGTSFATATRLRRHAKVHEGAERYRCRGYEGCNETFRKHQTLQRHVRTAHMDMKPFICVDNGCDASFDTAAALRRHKEREHGELKFWCDECAKGNAEHEGRRVGFTTLYLLQTHMRKEHVNCAFCDIKCHGQADLERHIEMYHSGTTVQDRKTVFCEWEGCGKSFTRVSNLNTHIRTAHEGLRFVCGQVDTSAAEDLAEWNWMEEGCAQSFVSKLKLEEHVRFVHLGRQRPPKVYTITTKSTAQIEEITGVLSNRTITCTVADCPARFARHVDLTKHLEEDHVDYYSGIDPIDPRLVQSDVGADHSPNQELFPVRGDLEPVGEPAGEVEFDENWCKQLQTLMEFDTLSEGLQQAA